jgi:hypothetical protein
MILNPKKAQAQSTPSNPGGWGGLEVILEVNLEVSVGNPKKMIFN